MGFKSSAKAGHFQTSFYYILGHNYIVIKKRPLTFYTCIEKAAALYLWLRGHTQVQHNVRISGVQVDVLSHHNGAIILNEVKWMRRWRDELPVSLQQQKRLQQAASILAEKTGRTAYVQGVFCALRWPFVKIVSLTQH